VLNPRNPRRATDRESPAVGPSARGFPATQSALGAFRTAVESYACVTADSSAADRPKKSPASSKAGLPGPTGLEVRWGEVSFMMF
jgi:hypothetical protein